MVPCDMKIQYLYGVMWYQNAVYMYSTLLLATSIPLFYYKVTWLNGVIGYGVDYYTWSAKSNIAFITRFYEPI